MTARAILFLKNQGIFVALAAIFLYFSTFVKGFLSIENMLDIPSQIAFIVLIAIGMTFVIISAGIDLSVGAIVAVAAVTMALLNEHKAFPVPLAAVIALCAGAALGAFNGFSIVRFNVPAFISTLAMMTIARGIARILAGNTKIFISSDISLYTDLASTGRWGPVPIALIMFSSLLFFWFVISKTRFGRYVYAVGGNEEAAKLSGINVARVRLLIYTISGFLSSTVGVLLAFKFKNGNPEYGLMWELDAIAAVVVGGTSLFGGRGSVFRTFIGALLIGVLDNGLLLMGKDQNTIYIIKGFVILAAVLLDQIKAR
ncbi:MAG: ABC transporter permease [bacterium]